MQFRKIEIPIKVIVVSKIVDISICEEIISISEENVSIYQDFVSINSYFVLISGT